MQLTNLIRNEQTKLLATGLNNLGIATIVGGAIGPLIARSYGASNASGLYLVRPVGIRISGVGFGIDALRPGRADGVGRMTFNEFLLWLIPPAILLAGGAFVTYWPRRHRH